MADPLWQALAGRYEGDGAWHDEAGDSKRYRIDMHLEPQPDGTLRDWFRHSFCEEGTEASQAIRMTPRGNGVLDILLEGTAIAGRGYCSGTVLHYELDVPGNPVQVTQQAGGDGTLTITGSARKNAQGRYIWWQETLRRLS